MAAFRLVINHLKKDELIYELGIRGVMCDDTKTVEELRCCLRPILKLEKANTSFSYPDYSFDVDAELQIVSDKSEELSSLIVRFKSGVLKQSPEILKSRLHHLLNRLDKMPIASLAKEKVQQRSDLLARVLGLLDSLDTPTQPDEATVPGDTAVGLESIFAARVGQNYMSDSEDAPEIVSPPAHNSTGISPIVSHSSQPVQKWNLKFTGDPKGISVHNFLERVDELRLARNVSEQQLIESAIDLFGGKALLWYRSNKQRVSDWQSLSRLLVKHYEPPDYRDRLFEEIISRTQDPSESFVEYYSCMLSMFRRYGSVAEDIQLRIISKNLAPFYTMQLPTVTSLANLEDECLKLEQRKYRVDNYRPPLRRRNASVEPDFAFVGVGSSTNYDSSTRPMVNSVENASRLKCYNCDQLGHAFRECSAPRRVFCYKCGRLNVTVRRCPNCSGSGNAARRR